MAGRSGLFRFIRGLVSSSLIFSLYFRIYSWMWECRSCFEKVGGDHAFSTASISKAGHGFSSKLSAGTDVLLSFPGDLLL